LSKRGIELTYDDLAGGAEAAAGVEAGVETPGDLVSTVKEVSATIQDTINSAKELIQMLQGFQGNSGAKQPGQPYNPQPTAQQQMRIVLNRLYAVYGDMTAVELLQTLTQQYGGLRLSEILKFLK